MRETRYTSELAADVCLRVSGGDSLRKVCRDTGMPEATVRQWVRDDREGFAAQYQQARAMQVEAWADEIVETACRDDLDPADKRVRCDAYKWIVSKLAPKKYGDRLLVAGDAANPIELLHKQVSLDALSNEQLVAIQEFCERMISAQKAEARG